MMSDNLPPGVTASMIPGNRPEDEEVEIPIVLSLGEIDDLRWFNDKQKSLPISERHELWMVISLIVEQIDETDIS